MIGERGVFDAINALLVKKWPNSTIYDVLNMQDFKRPSFYIHKLSHQRKPVAPRVLEHTEKLRIVCFGKIDDYGNQDQKELDKLQYDVMALFDRGYILVPQEGKPRAPKVTATAGGGALGEAYADLTVTYFDDADVPREQHDLMQDVDITYNGRDA